jgi:hypothetical protein
MSFRQYALIQVALALLLALAIGRPACGQTLLGSQAGVLVLRNGQVLEGDVTRAGDYYIVSKNEGSELRMKADDVELVCGSLDEAYEFKVRHLSGISAKPHLELAKWCLRQNLYARCAEQLTAASLVEPDNRELKDLETRLKLIVEAPPEPTPTRAAPTIAADELEKALRDLPKVSIEKFSAVVQPILLNRCGANQCHGPNAKSEFRLLRPPPGQIVSRRFTQRNLYAALRQLDASNPDASPLVALPQQRHGNSLAAVFDKHSANQLAELAAWARMTIAPSAIAPSAIVPSPHPATIAPTETTLSQPATSSIRMATSATESPGSADPNHASPTGIVRVMRPPLDQPGASAAESPPRPPSFRDRFDPEIFNRRYHGK